MIVTSELAQLKKICELICRAEQPVRTLNLVSWAPKVKLEFLARNGEVLPKPEYSPFDPTESFELLRQAETLVGSQDTPVNLWLLKIIETIRSACKMLSARGTRDFYHHSRRLYGHPKSRLHDGVSNSLSLANTWVKTIDRFVHNQLLHLKDTEYTAEHVQQEIQVAVNKMLKSAAPEVVLTDDISANASATSKIIKLRRSATFSSKDILQLIHHEAGVHVTTFVNGSLQDRLPILACAHSGTTRTQEGMAVFAELITGSIDVARMRRLVGRVHAIQMAIDGADFLDVYRFYLETFDDKPEDAFDFSRRVFRGGVLTGGAPFTKDVVYLDGLLRVHNFLRTVVSTGRLDCLKLLFCGKIDLEDIPVLCQLAAEGCIREPRYLPKWIADPDFLVTYLTYSSFLNRVNFSRIKQRYQDKMASSPLAKFRTFDEDEKSELS